MGFARVVEKQRKNRAETPLFIFCDKKLLIILVGFGKLLRVHYYDSREYEV